MRNILGVVLISVSVLGIFLYHARIGVVPRSLTAAVAGFLGDHDGSTVTIGAAVGLTGVCAEWGEGELKAEQLAVDEANARGGIAEKLIFLIVEDTQCDPKGTVNAVKKLIEINKAEAILGPTWGDSFQSGTVVSNAARVVAVSPSTAMEALLYNKQPISYVFSTWFPEKAEIDTLQSYARTIHKKNLVILSDEDPFASMMASLFSAEAPAHGLQIIRQEKFPLGSDDFRTTIVQLKSLRPDAVFISFEGAGPKAKFLKEAHDLGLGTQVFSSSDIEDQSLLAQFGSVMGGIIYTRPEVSGDQAAFAEAYRAAYQQEPIGQSAENAYDAARVVIAALTDHYVSGIDVQVAIEKMNIPGTAVRSIQFNDTHQLTGSNFQIKTVRKGQFVVVQ